MIEKYYAAHIKTMLDAAAINVRKGNIQRERRNQEGDGNPIRVERNVREGGRKPALRRERNTREGVLDRP